MGLDVAAVARVEPNAGAATGAAEPKPVLWPKSAMAAEADGSPNTWKEEFNNFGKYLPETLKSMLWFFLFSLFMQHEKREQSEYALICLNVGGNRTLA